MWKLLPLAFAAALLSPATSLAASAATTSPAITSLTLTPTTASEGRIYLQAAGVGIHRYAISAACPDLLHLKFGSRSLCNSGVQRLPERRLRKLWLNLRNFNDVSGLIEISVRGIAKDGSTTPARSVSLTVTLPGD